MHDMRQGGHDESPSGNGLQRIGEAWRQTKQDVLYQDLLEDLQVSLARYSFNHSLWKYSSSFVLFIYDYGSCQAALTLHASLISCGDRESSSSKWGNEKGSS